MVLASESFATNITTVWPLVRMSPFMDQQVVRLGKLPITELADELLFGSGRPTRRCPKHPMTDVSRKECARGARTARNRRRTIPIREERLLLGRAVRDDVNVLRLLEEPIDGALGALVKPPLGGRQDGLEGR